MLDNNIVSKATIDGWVNNAYTPNLKAIDYQLVDGNPPSIRLFTHAPVRFDIIEKIANRLGVAYQDETASALAQTIDSINAALTEHIQAGTIHTLCTAPPGDPANLNAQEIEAYPLVYLIWNRWSPEDDQDETARPSEKKGFFDIPRYNLEYYHGHDGAFSKSLHVYNLDNAIGKNLPDEMLMEKLQMAEEELAKSEHQMADIDSKLARGELTQAAADMQKQYLQHNINIYRASIDGFHYSAFSADANGLAAPKRSFADRIPGFNAVRAFFADVYKTIVPNNAAIAAILPQRRTVNITDVQDTPHQDTNSEPAENLSAQQTMAQKAQGWFNSLIATTSKTAKQFVSAVREEVLSRTDPDYKAKQEFLEAMIHINREVTKYNAADNRLRLYEGGAHKCSLEEVNADMQKMVEAVANLKKIIIPDRAEDIAEHYKLDPKNRIGWSNYKECMMIREGIKTPENLFNDVSKKLNPQPQVHAWEKSQSHEHHSLAVNNNSATEDKVLTQESKKKLHDNLPVEQGEIDTERAGQRQHF